MVNTEKRPEPDQRKIEISVRNLNIYYDSFHALNNVSIDVPCEEVTALIGPSGCGKSTFLRSINRMNDLIPAAKTTGDVLVCGESILGPGVDVVELRKKVGMVFQRPNPFPMTIFNNVAYGPRIHKMAPASELDAIVEKSLRDVALWDEVKDKLRKSAFDLSGGQQQRLCIARLLAVKPDILLMDEPCSALDPLATLKIEELMHTLKAEYTIVIVTHNMQQAARVSGITAFFLQGELLEIGETKDIFTMPKNKKTEDYITGRFG